ncbi:MAG: YbaN family protein [Bacteroidetes bacterium]|nr:YbaN family protein [Bacteroidota bacterium]
MVETNRDKQEEQTGRLRVTQNQPLKWLYITLGTVAVGLGFLGIFLPLLPTTAFLLLAAWAYARSSPRFYHWLLNNRLFGRYITAYLQGKGMPVISKVSTILLLWLTILATTIFFVENIYVRIVLIMVAIGVSIHIVTLPTLRRSNESAIKTGGKSAPQIQNGINRS